MSRRLARLRLSKWLFLRTIIDRKIKIIKVMRILREGRSKIKIRKRIIVLLRIVRIALEGLGKRRILKIQISCLLNLALSKMGSSLDKIIKKSQMMEGNRWVGVGSCHRRITWRALKTIRQCHRQCIHCNKQLATITLWVWHMVELQVPQSALELVETLSTGCIQGQKESGVVIHWIIWWIATHNH